MAKICAIKVQEGIVEIETVQEEILIDNSIEEYMKELKETMKVAKKALIQLNTEKDEDINKGVSININSKNPLYQALQLTPISELEYII